MAKADFFFSCKKILQINTFVSQKRWTIEESVTFTLVQTEEVFYPLHAEEMLYAISVYVAYLPRFTKALKEHINFQENFEKY